MNLSSKSHSPTWRRKRARGHLEMQLKTDLAFVENNILNDLHAHTTFKAIP
jgi:hypothetical protein